MIDGRPMPVNWEAERCLLGQCMLDGDILDGLAELPLDRRAFSRPDHRAIYSLLQELRLKGRPTDSVAVAEEIARRTGPDRSIGPWGDVGYAVELLDHSPSTATWASVAGVLQADLRRRQGIEACCAALEDLYAGHEDPGRILTSHLKRIEDLSAVGEEPGAWMNDIIDEEEEDYAERAADDGAVISTGFKALDALVDIMPGKIITIMGMPGHGKSALAQNLCRTMGGAAVPMVVWTGEMSKVAYARRIVQSETRVHGRYRATGRQNDISYDRWQEGNDWARQLPIYIVDRRMPIPEIITEIRRRDTQLKCVLDEHREQVFPKGVEVAVFDYAQLVKPPHPGMRAKEAVDENTKMILAASKHLKFAAVVLYQPYIERGRNHTLKMEDAGDSKQIVKDSDIFLCIWWDGYFTQAPDRDAPAEDWEAYKRRRARWTALVDKNRGGPRGKCTLRFTETCTRFDDWPDEWPLEDK